MNAVDLNQALRAAVADAPPTTIDLDGLIGKEQRRQRSIRILAVACGAAASVLAIAGVMVGLPGPASTTQPAAPGPASSSSARPCPRVSSTGNPRPYQSGGASPRPITESCGDAAARLDGVLRAALATHAPGVNFGDVSDPGEPARLLRDYDDNVKYIVGMSVTTAAGRGSFAVDVQRRTYEPLTESELRRSYGCDKPSAGATCVHRSYPDGTLVSGALLLGTSDSPWPAGSRRYQIDVFHPDGTHVYMTVSNNYYDGPPDPRVTPKVGGTDTPLTLEQIIAIGRDPGLTLYP